MNKNKESENNSKLKYECSISPIANQYFETGLLSINIKPKW